MVEKLGKIALSCLISNWIYSETLLLFPQIEPFTQRVIQVARIPTHDEWPQVARAKSAKQLGTDISDYLTASSMAPVFVKVGVLDRKVQKLVSKRQGSTVVAEQKNQQPVRLFLAGEGVFVGAEGKKDLLGGYQEFKFRIR